MKRCPACGREYDNSMMFCLDDGAELLYGPASMDGPATAVLPLPLGGTSSESATQPQIHTTAKGAEPQAISGKATNRAAKPLMAAGVLIVILAGSYFGYRYLSPSGPKQIESIAVMPFVNESGNPDIEYLSDGMTETLINSLSQVPNLSVKARSLVFRYKGKDIEPKKIAGELNVQAIVTGRIVERGGQLTLNLELIDGQSENTLWGNKYERKASDLVSLQSEIARDVSSKLKARLSGAEIAKVEKNSTTDSEAFQLYLKGKFHWNKRTEDALKQATTFYRQAIERDPNYALAYSGLAETFVLYSSYDVASADDSMPQAKAAAMRALEIDDTLAEAHTALAFYLANYEWDRDRSEQEYRRAIGLKPNYSTAHHWFGADIGNLRRFDESLAEMKLAEELDPLSSIIGSNIGDMLVLARRYDEAIAQYKRVIARNPDFPYVYLAMSRAYGGKGMYDEAIAATRRYQELSGSPVGEGLQGLWLAKSGKRDDAIKVLGDLKQAAEKEYIQNYDFALIYIGLGDREEALNFLERHMTARAETANTFAVAPELDELRSDPRFEAMLEKMNLPQ